MSLTVSAKGGKQFAIHPAGVVAARATRIIDLGHQRTEYKGEVKDSHKILIQWESEQLMEDGEHAGKPFLISQRYTASLSEKAVLRKDLESWRGRKFTPAELERFDLKTVLGKPCMLNIVHNETGGKTYANISSIMPLPASMTAPKAVGDLIFFSFEDFDSATFAKLSENLQKTISEAKEFKSAQAAPVAAGDIDDSDIPF